MCLKNYISQHEQKNVDNEKTIKSIRKRIGQVQKENEENESQIYSLEAQLEAKESRMSNLHEQSIALRQENRKLKEAVTEFENNKSISGDLNKSNLETQDSDIEDNGEPKIDDSGNQIPFTESNQLKQEIELSDNSDKQPKDSNFNDKQDDYNNGSTTVTVAQVYFDTNSEQNRDEIVEHKEHNDSRNYDYDFDDCDYYEYDEHEDNGELSQDSLIGENKQLKEEMESLDDFNKQLEDSDFNDTQNCDSEENVIVKTANAFENNEQITHNEILEHEEFQRGLQEKHQQRYHDESDDQDYDYDHGDHYEYNEHEDYNEYNEYSEYDYNQYEEYEYNPHDGDDFIEHDGSNRYYENNEHDLEKFDGDEAETDGGALEND